jgi:N-acetylglucosaminyldiphosphoundecaprenol N-acetyl-beta-D-mannosaminyltransferase
LREPASRGAGPITTKSLNARKALLRKSQPLELRQPIANSSFTLLGVELANLSVSAALRFVCDRLRARDSKSLIFIANAHTLDLAYERDDFKRTLNEASRILADGLGVRLGARLNGIGLADNLCGTDFIPRLLSIKSRHRYRYYLLGATPSSIADAARQSAASFPNWQQVGFHHGYFEPESSLRIVETINAAQPDLLLVGMGSPLQERWLVQNRAHLRVPVCVAVGGLFDFWSGRRTRAPVLLRKWSLEWLHIAITEPHKWRRYAFRAPRYLARVATARLAAAYRARS